MKMPEQQYDEIHKSVSSNGVVNLYSNSSSWHGVSRQGNIIDFVDLDFGVGITKSNLTSFEHISELLVDRSRTGENILI